MQTTLLETCQIPPPPGAAELSLPLTFFDLVWLHFHPVRQLLFYEHPCSKPEFLNTLLPKLKQSLSLTLKHYLPVAGNLLYPNPNTNKIPIFRYLPNDSISLTIAESTHDFNELVGSQARDADDFYNLIPQMPPITEGPPGYRTVPVFALQVTLFPGRGICIGITNHHSLGDASAIHAFMSTWALINKFDGDEDEENFFIRSSLPVIDRSVINYPRGIDAKFWDVMNSIPFNSSRLMSFPVPTNRVRATFVLDSEDINKLKDLVLAKKPSLVRVSAFVVTTSYVWSCLAKSASQEDEDHESSQSQVFAFAADARGRLSPQINPPAPKNYFGNCIGGGAVIFERKNLVGEEGFVIAAEAIAKEIKNNVNNKDEFLKNPENWLLEMKKLYGMKGLGVAGSPKFDLYFADFGWGVARKVEVLTLDSEDAMSLCNCMDSKGGLEVGLSLPKERMKVFAAIFANGLQL